MPLSLRIQCAASATLPNHRPRPILRPSTAAHPRQLPHRPHLQTPSSVPLLRPSTTSPVQPAPCGQPPSPTPCPHTSKIRVTPTSPSPQSHTVPTPTTCYLHPSSNCHPLPSPALRSRGLPGPLGRRSGNISTHTPTRSTSRRPSTPPGLESRRRGRHLSCISSPFTPASSPSPHGEPRSPRQTSSPTLQPNLAAHASTFSTPLQCSRPQPQSRPLSHPLLPTSHLARTIRPPRLPPSRPAFLHILVPSLHIPHTVDHPLIVVLPSPTSSHPVFRGHPHPHPQEDGGCAPYRRRGNPTATDLQGAPAPPFAIHHGHPSPSSERHQPP